MTAGSALIILYIILTRCMSERRYHLQAPLYPGSVLHRLVTTARITVGCKLITQGAEITGSQAKTPCHPLGKYQ